MSVDELEVRLHDLATRLMGQDDQGEVERWVPDPTGGVRGSMMLSSDIGADRYPSNAAAVRRSDPELDRLIALAQRAASGGAFRNCQEWLAEANVRALVLIGGGK